MASAACAEGRNVGSSTASTYAPKIVDADRRSKGIAQTDQRPRQRRISGIDTGVLRKLSLRRNEGDVDYARVADSMNTLRHISSWTLLVLALGTSLAVAQEDQPVPKTKAAAAHPSSTVAAGVPGADESPWAKLCAKDEQTGNKQICLVQHGGLDAETGILLGNVAVRSVEGEDKQTLLVGLTTTYSLVVPVGVAIKIDDGEPISLRYVVCFPGSCQAQIELTKEIFDKMRKGKQMSVAAMNAQQKRVGFPVPLTEFGKAYDGPTADPAKYQEALRQLVERSNQRQLLIDKKDTQQQQGTQQPQVGTPPQAAVPVPAQAPSH
jgi:invasion protein IalB